MIHRYAAWFCQGGLVRTLLQALRLVGPWVTRSGWESWDVRHDSVESCTCSATMLWGYRNGVWIGGCWRDFCTPLQMRKYMGQVLGCHFVGGKCMCSISLISVPPGGSALICTPPTPPRSTSQTRWKTCSQQHNVTYIKKTETWPLMIAFIRHLQENKEQKRTFYCSWEAATPNVGPSINPRRHRENIWQYRHKYQIRGGGSECAITSKISAWSYFITDEEEWWDVCLMWLPVGQSREGPSYLCT